jgi:hypothetical protein
VTAAVTAATAPVTAATAAAAAVTTETAATAAVAASAAVSGKFYSRARGSDVFLVEHIERCQADIRDFLLTEEDLIAISVA